MTRLVHLLAWLSASALVASCAVGPDFSPPQAPQVERYLPTPPASTVATPDTKGGNGQSFVEGRDIPSEWWQLFHSESLNALIAQALEKNPDLKAAQSALAIAHENVLAQRGAFFPSVTGGFSAFREKASGDLSPVTNSNALNFSLYTPELTISYTPDVFGLNRRTVEALGAQAEQARFVLIATRITLTSNIVAAAIMEAGLREQIAAIQRQVADEQEILTILRNQYAKGYASRLDVEAQELQLAQLQASLAPLAKQLEQQRHLLANLSGSFPDRELPETFSLSSLTLPGELPLSLPSKLVEQRPDIRQAEENLHSASAQIGVAIANRLPSISLSANAGTEALAVSQLLSDSTGFWAVGTNATQTIFDGGTLLHKERAARDAYDQALEQYRSTVLGAFQNVADTLSALEHDAEALKTSAAACNAARVTYELTKNQVRAGKSSNLALFTAENAYQQATVNLVQAEAARFADTAALYQALGGGWWNERPSADHAKAAT